MSNRALSLVLVLVLCVLALPRAKATTVKELVRIRGEGQSILRGVGLVVGLSGTGDSGKELAVARPLASILDNSGNTIGNLRELQNSKSVALVLVTCIVPEKGARADDRLDITVSVVNSASSLKGGELYIAPMRGPFPDSPVFAVAQGLVDLQDPSVPTLGRVRGGARMIEDILMPEIGDVFDLMIETPFAGWAAASQIASAINAKAQPQGPPVAFAVDERTIRVTIPVAERQNRAGFLADVLAAEVNMALLDLPAQVIVNQRTGAIIFTGDVQISPVVITHKDLNLTTTKPAPVPSPANPIVERDRLTGLNTETRPSEAAKLTDLIAAFKQLDIPVEEQIGVLQMLHKTGKLQAKLIID